MNDFTTAYPKTVKLDANKRVNYVHGLVLGVDEFLQEELYFLKKHRMHNRLLHGYGTVCGLWVNKEDTGNGPLIKVGAGVAVNPKGQKIRVPLDQCALLNEWLTHHQAEVEGVIGSPPSSLLSLYLVLCYRECETDRVPIPTGPCQSLEETSAASRIADNFSLSLELMPPDQTEDETLQELVCLLQSIPVLDAPGGLTREELEDLIRELRTASPPASPPVVPKHMRPFQVNGFIDAAFLVWVTEVRPHMPEGGNCVSGPSMENCVLLSRLEFNVELTESVLRVNGPVEIYQQGRPYLLHTRLFQEYLRTCCAKHGEMVAAHLDNSTLVHLAGAETITGQKTFAAPLILSGTGRAEKHVVLPVHQTYRVAGTRHGLLRGAPALQFTTTGTQAFRGYAAFSLPTFDDIDESEDIQFRLLWGFQGGAATGGIELTWEVGNQFIAVNDTIPANIAALQTVTLNSTETVAQRDRLLVTKFQPLPDPVVEAGDEYGMLAVRLTASTPATRQVYLVQIELAYIANRLGRAIS